MLLQPRHAVWVETKRHNDRVCWHDKFRTGNRLRAATALFVRFTHLGAQHPNPHHTPAVIQLNVQRLDVKFKLRPFFTGIFHLFFGAWHVGFVTAISAGDLLSAVAN
ncbi:hypothetical protein D3C75_1027970 [compost metagenome]